MRHAFFRDREGADALRVLIVEDEALVAMELEGMLGLAGHVAVAQADDVASAIEAAEATRPDLALVDMQLADGASGLSVAAALGERGVPVLFATGNPPSADQGDVALGCLQKPISDQALAAAIAAAEAIIKGRPAGAVPPSLRLYRNPE